MDRRALLLGSLALAGCSGAGLVDALTPDEGYRLVPDLAYGDGARRRLDLYLPPEGAGPFPVVVFFYGGGWDTGERGFYRFLGQALASNGIALAVPDYRLYPEVSWPGFLEDNAAATAWVAREARRWGGDPRRLFLMGHSAGAYNAVELAVDGRWLGAHGLQADRDLRGAIGFAGPYDFLPTRDRKVATIFGPPEGWPATQPINHVHADAPPLLLASGVDDTIVYPRQTRRMAARVREAGGRVVERYYDGTGHLSIIGAFAAPLRWTAPALADTLQFVYGATA